MSTCGYCGADLERDRVDVSSFGSHRRTIVVEGGCSARCVPPTCITCDHQLDTDRRCCDLDCPLYGHRQWEMTP